MSADSSWRWLINKIKLNECPTFKASWGKKKKPNKTIDFQNMTLGTMEAIKNSFLFEQDTFFESHSEKASSLVEDSDKRKEVFHTNENRVK